LFKETLNKKCKNNVNKSIHYKNQSGADEIGLTVYCTKTALQQAT